MNENPGGSPNPLSPNPGVGPDTNINPQDNNPGSIESFEPEGQAQMGGTASQADVLNQSQNAELDPLAKATAGITDASNDPTMRPMEKAATPEAPVPQKKKTGLIVGITIAAVLLICGGIVAAILLLGNKGDAVAQAIKKIADGNIPTNVALDGTIDLIPKDSSSMITDLRITVQSQAATQSMLNATDVKVAATFQENETVSFDVNEIYAANGDLYLKVDGLTKAITDFSNLSAIVEDDDYLEEPELLYDEEKCVDDESGETKCGTEEIEVDCLDGEGTDCISDTEEYEDYAETNCIGSEDMNCLDSTQSKYDYVSEMLGGFSSALEVIDGEWIKISTDLINQISDSGMADSNVTCLTNFVSDVNKNTNSLSGAYNNNQFITSTTEGVTLASKSGSPVYKITINTEKFDGFVNTVKNMDFVNTFVTCMGGSSSSINTDSLVGDINELPDIYVEVDNDNNFSRIYFEDESSSDYTMTTDLGFTYPSSINVAEPTEYQDLVELIQQLFSGVDQGQIPENI